MRLIRLAAAIPAAFILLTACTPMPVQPVRTQLQIRQDQTREFDTPDQKLVMKAVLNALQDSGFVTKNAVVDLGLITATKERDEEDFANKMISSVIMGNEAQWPKSSVVDATMNVSQFGRSTRVRASFQRKVLDNRGNVVSIEDVIDPEYYQRFFAEVDKSIFIQKQNI